MLGTAAPHESKDIVAAELGRDVAAHCSHALAEKAALPVGKDAACRLYEGAEMELPRARLSAPRGAPSALLVKVMLCSCATVGKAATPSICEPDRKNAVSTGLGSAAAEGAQPLAAETKVAPASQLAQLLLP
jgi:hypothetical protein